MQGVKEALMQQQAHTRALKQAQDEAKAMKARHDAELECARAEAQELNARVAKVRGGHGYVVLSVSWRRPQIAPSPSPRADRLIIVKSHVFQCSLACSCHLITTGVRTHGLTLSTDRGKQMRSSCSSCMNGNLLRHLHGLQSSRLVLTRCVLLVH